jgi:hypothetical protein
MVDLVCEDVNVKVAIDIFHYQAGVTQLVESPPSPKTSSERVVRADDVLRIPMSKASRDRRPRQEQVCAGVTQLVESQPSKLLVAGSSPVSRSTLQIENRRLKLQSPASDIVQSTIVNLPSEIARLRSSVGRARPW